MRYTHDYSQTLTYKILNARKPDRVFATFEQSLQAIRQVHDLSGGIRQIVYLAGWQYDGHDSKYPAWFAGNERLKRPGDRDAMASIRWLMEAAKQFNAIVSLHINMDDAYPNSPLWDGYLKQELIVRKPDGTIREAGMWDGEMSYHVSKPREWQAGLAQRRIDELLQLLPIAEAGTIHIDAFRPQQELVYAGISYEQELQVVKDIINYWRAKGIDVTTEFLADHELVGYHPMVYHYNPSEQTRLRYPPSLICGGGAAWNQRRVTLPVADRHVWHGGYFVPEGGCLFEEAWGYSVDRDLGGTTRLEQFAEDFYLRALPWHYLNRHRAQGLCQTADHYRVTFEGGVESEVRTADRYLTIRQGEQVLVNGTDVFCPATWAGDAWIGYSKTGGTSRWRRPATWGQSRCARVQRLWPAEKPQLRSMSIGDEVELNLSAGEAVLVRPE